MQCDTPGAVLVFSPTSPSLCKISKTYSHAEIEKPDVVTLAEAARHQYTIKIKPAKGLANGDSVETEVSHIRTIEKFMVHGLTVIRIIFGDDVDVAHKSVGYNTLQAARDFDIRYVQVLSGV